MGGQCVAKHHIISECRSFSTMRQEGKGSKGTDNLVDMRSKTKVKKEAEREKPPKATVPLDHLEEEEERRPKKKKTEKKKKSKKKKKKKNPKKKKRAKKKKKKKKK